MGKIIIIIQIRFKFIIVYSGDNVSRPKPKTYKPLVKISRPLVKKYRPLVNVSRPLRKTSRPLVKISRPLVKLSRPLRKISRPLVKKYRREIFAGGRDLVRPLVRPLVCLSNTKSILNISKLSARCKRCHLYICLLLCQNIKHPILIIYNRSESPDLPQ